MPDSIIDSFASISCDCLRSDESEKLDSEIFNETELSRTTSAPSSLELFVSELIFRTSTTLEDEEASDCRSLSFVLDDNWDHHEKTALLATKKLK